MMSDFQELDEIQDSVQDSSQFTPIQNIIDSIKENHKKEEHPEDDSSLGKEFKIYKEIFDIIADKLSKNNINLQLPNKNQPYHYNQASNFIELDLEDERKYNWDKPYNYFDKKHPGIPEKIVRVLAKKFGPKWYYHYNYEYALCDYFAKDEKDNKIPEEHQNVIIGCRKHGFFRTTFAKHIKSHYGDCSGCRLNNLVHELKQILFAVCQNCADIQCDKLEIELEENLTLVEKQEIFKYFIESLGYNKIEKLLTNNIKLKPKEKEINVEESEELDSSENDKTLESQNEEDIDYGWT